MLMNKIKMNIRKSAIAWTFVLIILSCNIDVEAAKASRPKSNRKTPNHSHVALSYPSSHSSHGHSNTHQQPVQKQTVHQSYNPAPSAPVLPSNTHNTNINNNNKPVGWDVPHSNTPVQQHTVPNTHSAPPAYHPGPPPPYSSNPQSGFNSHVPAGPPPPYSANPQSGFNSHVPAGQPAYPAGASYPSELKLCT